MAGFYREARPWSSLWPDVRAQTRAHARFSRDSPVSTETDGLDGGARGIRTPGAARAYLGGIRPDIGALFGPNKSIRAGENLFAWNSALLQLFLASDGDSLLSSFN